MIDRVSGYRGGFSVSRSQLLQNSKRTWMGFGLTLASDITVTQIIAAVCVLRGLCQRVARSYSIPKCLQSASMELNCFCGSHEFQNRSVYAPSWHRAFVFGDHDSRNCLMVPMFGPSCGKPRTLSPRTLNSKPSTHIPIYPTPS